MTEIHTLEDKAKTCLQNQDLQQAVNYYQQILALNHHHFDAAYQLASLSFEARQLNVAMSFANRALANLEGCQALEKVIHLGNIFKDTSHFPEAQRCYHKALTLAPSDFNALFNMGYVVSKQSNTHNGTNITLGEQALEYYHRALEQQRNWQTLLNIALILQEQGQSEQAITYLEEALQSEPNNAQLHVNYALALTSTSQQAKAKKHFRKALSLDPNNAEAYFGLSHSVALKPYDKAMTNNINSSLSNKRTSAHQHMLLNYSLGKIYHDNDEYSKAFEHYQQANNLENKANHFEVKNYHTALEHYKKIYTPPFFKTTEPYGNPSTVPIFIVGMPRSGSTLVEQILSSHSQITGAGELQLIASTAKNIIRQCQNPEEFPACLEHKQAIIKSAASDYLSGIQHLTISSDITHITDKMPANFLQIGLIHVLFPNAKIINCKRHPLDIIMSIYCNYMPHLNYSNNIQHIVEFFKMYHTLMAHWHKVLPGVIYDNYYEALVSNSQDYIPPLVEHCSVAWQKECLEPHKNKRDIATVSKSQIRQPIHNKSINRWHHYKQQLDNVKAMLHDEIVSYENMI